jgi:hypothetical protein
MKTFQQFLSDINEAAIEYVTGDETHSRYAADHGGSNYHDHIAFKDEKTRKAAQQHLQKLGWEIGSTTGGKHAPRSFHYSGQAFDVPMYRPSGRGVQQGFSDDVEGERSMSAKLRADLVRGGFGGAGIGGSQGLSKPSPSTKSEPSKPVKVLAKLKGKTGELDKSTGKFTQRNWSEPEGTRYKAYGGK